MNKRFFKERISKSLAVVLAFALILTNMNMTAFAAEPQGTGNDQKIITKVKEPDSSVLSQTLSVGAEESDIQFPESLTVTVTKEPESETPAEPETEKEIVPETEQSEVTETEEKSSEEMTEEPSETEEKSSETEQTESTESEEKSSETEQTETPETEVNAPETESVQTTETEQKAIETESTEATEITETTEIEKSVAEQLFGWLAPVTVYAAELNETEENIAVTWKLDENASTSEAFDASKAGNTYVYIPVIPGGYTVAEGVELPKITVTIGKDKERSEVIKAVQSRINALPTVDEFIALADGTTVEDSTLNQAQLDVYNEAQAIAEEIDQLTDEEQGQLDTGKLDALFEYFNGMTEETALSPGSTVTLTKYVQYIEKAGTYYVNASSGLTASSTLLKIQNTSSSDNIVINIQGNITVNDSATIIDVASPCNLTINGNGKTIKNSGSSNVLIVETGTVHLKDCNFTSNTGVTLAQDAGTLYIESGYYKRTGSLGQVVSSTGGTLYIQGGTIENASSTGTSDTVAIGGKLYMTGGTIISPKSAAIRSKVSGASMSVTGGTIKNSLYGVYVHSNNPACTIGNVTFSGNTNDVYLGSGQKFTLTTDYAGANNIKVGIADTVGDSVKRQITTTGTAQSMLAKVSSVNGSYSVNYDTSGTYLYLWKHSHSWNYSASGNTVTAKCNTSSCGYSSGLTLTLTAPDMDYTGSAYDKASVTNNITSVTGATAGTIKYYKTDAENTTTGGTSLSSDPTDAGYYYASVTIGGATATAAFKITSVQLQESDVTLDSSSFERTGSEISPTVTVKVTVDGKEITLKAGTDYEVSGDISKTDVGSYTLTVTGKGNYSGTFNKTWEITKQKATVEPEIDGWTYGETANTPGVADGSNPENGEVTYTYYKDAECTIKTTSEDGAASDGEAPKNAGTYYVKAEVAETNNYAAGSGTKEFTIEPKEIGVEWSDDSLTYNGQIQAPTATATGLLKGDTCTITVTGGQKDTNAKTGNDKYTATAVTIDNKNYKLPTSGTTHDFTITPAELTVTWTDTELTYNGSEQAPKAELSGVLEGDTCDVTVTGGKTDTNVKSQQGTYTAEAECTDKNYVVNEQGKTTEFTITPKDIEDAEIELTPGDQIHNGNEITQTVSRVTVDGKNLAEGSDYKIDDSSILTATDFGTYTVTVTGTGNYKGSFSKEWKIKDENPPTGEISIAEKKWTEFLNNITFGHFFKETQTVTIKASDVGSGVDKIYYYNSNEALQEDAVKALADDKWTEIANGGSYNVDPEDNYVVYVKITDKSGNVTYISSEGFVVDKTAPKITGVENNGTYCEDVTFTATDANLKTVTVDGNEVTLNADGSYTIKADNKTHTITATDKAGNTTTVQVTLYDGHEWGDPVYTWSSDNTTCTAESTCKHDATKETETVTVVMNITKAADCENEGEATYTATFTKSMFAEQTKTDTIKALGHDYGTPVFTWSDDLSSATAVFTCARDENHTKTENCTITKQPSTATCTEAGKVVYKASVTLDGQTYTDTKEKDVPATGHAYGEPVFTWSADYSSAEAVFTCANDESHVETVECTVKKEITGQATGSEKGKITYTATVTIDGKTYQDTKTQETVIAGSEEIGSSGGKITTEIIVSDDMPKTEIKNLTVETAKSLLTVEELAQVEAGAEITIYLEANSLDESAVSTTDKNHVESQLDSIAEKLVQSEGLTSKKEVATGIQYIDLSLYKRIGNGAATKLKSTGENELEITVEIPDNLKSANSKRTYHVIRVHETDTGTEVDILPTTKSGDTLTFTTDRFSTYAIAYAEPNGVIVPTKVTLNKTEATLTSKGSTLQLTATVEPDNATNKNVTWKSSDTSVATVDENGLVTAVGNGTATITVTTEEGGLTATVTITVNISSGGGGNGGGGNGGGTTPIIPEQKPTSVKIDKTNETLTSKGSTTQLTATVEPSNAANKKVTWKSSDTSVATVDANGVVTAVGNGTATITATTEEGGLTATATVTVNIPSDDNGGDGNGGETPNPPEVQKPASVKIDKTNETLTSKGSTTQLTATVEPSNASNKKVTWKSSDTSVAIVDENGLVTAVGNGTAVITVTTEEGGLTATATITVNIPSDDNGTDKPDVTPKPTETPDIKDQSGLSGGEVSKLKLPILLAKGKGGDKKIDISWVSYKGADGYDCYWSYCDGKQNFKKFAGVKATKYSITHKKLKNNREYKYFVAAYKMVDGKKVYIAKSNQLHVAMKNAKKTNAKKVTVNKTNVTLKAGKTFVIKSSTKLENTKKKQLLHAKEYRYYTSNKEVAYVSKNGRVKAVKKGKCVIYVLANNGVYRKIKIVVK